MSGSALGSNINATQNAASPVANAFSQAQGLYAQGGMNQAIQQLLAGRPGDAQTLAQYFGAGMQNTGMVNLQGAPIHPNLNPLNPGAGSPEGSQWNPGQMIPPTGGFIPPDTGGYVGPNGPPPNSGFVPPQLGGPPPIYYANGGDYQPGNFVQDGGGTVDDPNNPIHDPNKPTTTTPWQGGGPPMGLPPMSGGPGQTPSLNTRTYNQSVGPSNAQFNPQSISGAYNPNQNSYSPQAIQSNFNAPQYQNTQLQGPNTNLQPGALAQVQAPSMNLQQGPNVMQGMGQQAQLGNIINPAAQTEAMRAIMGQQQSTDIANLRERFGNQGLSSGAQLAESNYRAQASPQMAMALDQITRQNNEQALAQRGQDLSNFQGMTGNDTQRLGLGINQAQGMNNSMLGMSAQGLQAGQGNQQADIARMNANLQASGMSNEAILAFNQQMQQGGNAFNQFQQNNAQFGSAQNLAAQQANQAAGLQGLGMNIGQQQFGANFGQQAGQLNNQFAQQQAAMNQGNQQFNVNAALQNQQQGNQFNLGMQNVGLGMQQNQAQAQQFMMEQFMNNLRQTQMLGTPGAENVVSPGWGTQLLNFGGQVAGAFRK